MPRKRAAHAVLRDRQKRWAIASGKPLLSNGYFESIDDNLFTPLTPAVRASLERGDGDELGSHGGLAKLAAPWSSAALAINAFHYWHPEHCCDPRPLQAALSLHGEITSIGFEVKHYPGVGARASHLDVEIHAQRSAPVCVESKLCEPFAGSPKPLPASYAAEANAEKWAGLRRCREFAVRLCSGAESFESLDAPQLLKHSLALSRAYGERAFELVLLWSDPGHCDERANFVREIDRFAAAVADEVRFSAMTYGQLHARLMAAGGPSAAYDHYMRARYLPLAF